MEDVATKFLEQSKSTRTFFLIVGYILTGIAAAGFAANIYNGLTVGQAIVALPGQLVELIVAAWTLIFGGSDKTIDKLEGMLKVDIDKDGDIAGVPSAEPAAVVAPTADVPQFSSAPVTTSGPLYGPPV